MKRKHRHTQDPSIQMPRDGVATLNGRSTAVLVLPPSSDGMDSSADIDGIVPKSVERTHRKRRSPNERYDDRCGLLFFTLNREDFSFVIHLDRQPRTSRRREAQTGSRARSGSRSERTLDAVEHSRTLMEWWPFLIFHRGGLRIKVINNMGLAKNVFEIAISREAGKVSKQLRVSRPKLVSFFAKQSAATVLLEACGSAHFWARTLRRLGHDVVLLPVLCQNSALLK